MTSPDNAVRKFEVLAETEDIHVTLIANTGPPGPEGPQGEQGPQGEYGVGEGEESSLPEHIEAELPHPVYDDGASFILLYENAKV